MSFPRRTSPWDKALARLKHVAASPSERAKFDFFAPAAPFGTVYELLDAKDGNVRAWAAEFLLVDPDGPQDHAAQAAVRSRTRQLASVFKSQTSMDGKPLPLGSTRYLDEAVLAMHGSSVVQDTAIKLKLLPRDLEIMLFHAYADFDIDAATNPHALPKGASLISAVQERMIGDEAETLLEASQAIFWLRRFEGAAKKLGRSLNSLNLALPNHKYRIPVLQMLVSLDAKVKAITSDELFRKESDRLQRVYSALLDMSGAKTPPNG